MEDFIIPKKPIEVLEYESQVKELQEEMVREFELGFPELRSKSVKMATYREVQYRNGLRLIQESISERLAPLAKLYQLSLNSMFSMTETRHKEIVNDKSILKA